MTKRVLLLGSSFSSLPILFVLKKRGLHVTVCGADRSDPGHDYADESQVFDYSDSAAVLNHLREAQYDYIVPSCNDTSYGTAAIAAHMGGFVGYDNLEVLDKLHNKLGFRMLCSSIGVDVPIFYGTIAEVELAINAGKSVLPVIVKPVDSFSGRGVSVVSDSKDLSMAVESATLHSPTKQVVIEEFFDGSLHSHSAFIQDGEVYWDCFVDEFCTVYPFQVDCSNFPSKLSDGMRLAVRSDMMKVVEELGLCDGLLHTQFIASGGEFRIVETMRRAPGDLYGQLLERSQSLPYYEMYVQKFIGEDFVDLDLSIEPRCVLRHTVSVESGNSAFATKCIPGANATFVPLGLCGDKLAAAPYGKFGIWFSEFDKLSKGFAAVQNLAQHHRTEDWSVYGKF